MMFQIKSAAPSGLESVSATLRRVLSPPEAAAASDKKLTDWPQAVVTLCFLGGIGLLTLSDRIRREYLIPIQATSVSMALAFSLTFVSSFIPAKHPPIGWRQAVVTFCFAAGIGLLFVPDPTRRQCPNPFLLMPLLIAVAFSFVFTADFIQAKHPVAAGLLDLAGVLVAGAALTTALSIQLALGFQCLVWIVYAGAVAAVLLLKLNLISSPSACSTHHPWFAVPRS